MKHLLTSIIFILFFTATYGQRGHVIMGSARTTDTNDVRAAVTVFDSSLYFKAYAATLGDTNIMGVNSAGKVVTVSKSGIVVVSDTNNYLATKADLSDKLSGSGTTGYIPLYSGAKALGDSKLSQTGDTLVSTAYNVRTDRVRARSAAIGDSLTTTQANYGSGQLYAKRDTVNKEYSQVALAAEARISLTTTPSNYTSVAGLNVMGRVGAYNTQNWLRHPAEHPVLQSVQATTSPFSGASGIIPYGAVYYGTALSTTNLRFNKFALTSLGYASSMNCDTCIGIVINQVNEGDSANTYLLMGHSNETQAPAGNWTIYNRSDYPNYLGSGITYMDYSILGNGITVNNTTANTAIEAIKPTSYTTNTNAAFINVDPTAASASAGALSNIRLGGTYTTSGSGAVYGINLIGSLAHNSSGTSRGFYHVRTITGSSGSYRAFETNTNISGYSGDYWDIYVNTVGGKLGSRSNMMINTASALSTPTACMDLNGTAGHNQLRMRVSYTPSATADSNGNTGSFAWDDNYLYIKTSAGWKRVALSTF